MFNKAQQFLKDLRPVKELEKVWGDVQVCSELKFSDHNEYFFDAVYARMTFINYLLRLLQQFLLLISILIVYN